MDHIIFNVLPFRFAWVTARYKGLVSHRLGDLRGGGGFPLLWSIPSSAEIFIFPVGTKRIPSW